MSSHEFLGKPLVDHAGCRADGLLQDACDGAVDRSPRKVPAPTVSSNAHSSTPSSFSDLSGSNELESEDLSDMQDRGRSFLRTQMFIPSRRRPPPSSPAAPKRRQGKFSALKDCLDPTTVDRSAPEASASEGTVRAYTFFKPRPFVGSVAPEVGNENLGVVISDLFAGSKSSGRTPSENEESALIDDDEDVPVHTLVEGYRDTFALLDRRPRNTSNTSSKLLRFTQGQPDSPLLFLERLVWFIDHDTYLALRLTSSAWCTGITRMRPPVFPSVYRLPTELVQEIYGYLDPVDFNAARHTCRAWMLASMNTTLLQSMLQRGGWWGAAENRVATLIERYPASAPAATIRWALHSQLTRECALSAHWTGNGIVEFEIAQEEPITAIQNNVCTCLTSESVFPIRPIPASQTNASSELDSRFSPYSVVSIVDFSEFGEMLPFLQQSRSDSSDHETQFESKVRFSASKCGRFLLVCDNHRVFVYELCRDAVLRFVTCMSCPRKVLSVSMDTSCGRYAVAMLLHGRAGLVGHIAAYKDPAEASEFDTLEPVGSCISLGQKESGYRRVFWNVCTEEDPPLSVAISPQRSFVAFGSATGIEVHWIEANNHNVSRWFPLTAPSNHLYFLPSRRKITSPERIRLVSSAAIRSMSNSGTDGPFTGPTDDHRDYSAWSSEYLFGRWISRARDGHDSYHAIPLSDGEHVLFTDPRTQSLCLGGDAPVGGATERECRILFNGPEGIAPTVYAAGTDLSDGVRVLAGYGDELWFFSVPIDVFLCSNSGLNEVWSANYCNEVASETRSSSPQAGLAGEHLSRTSTGSASPTPTLHTSRTFPQAVRPRHRRGIWPLTLSGQKIGSIFRLREVAINSRPESLTLWAFSASGIAKAWQIRARPPQRLLHVIVNRCGNIAHSACLSPTHEPIAAFLSEATDEDTAETTNTSVDVSHDLFTASPSLYSFDGRGTPEPFPLLDLDGDVVMRDAPPMFYSVQEVEDVEKHRSDVDGAVDKHANEVHANDGSANEAHANDESATEERTINEHETHEAESAYRSDAEDETGCSNRLNSRPSISVVLCEIHDGGGAVCRGWMVPQGEASGLVLQWQGNEWSASDDQSGA